MRHYVPDMPAQEEEQPILFCDVCNGDLYTDDKVYRLDGDVICKGCLEDYFVHTMETL